MNFAVVERDFIRAGILPDFDWVVHREPSRINPLKKRLGDTRIAIVTTAGVHKPPDPPFDIKSRTGDTSYRQIPDDVDWDHLRLSHAGYNTREVRKDINCVFPLQRLHEVQTEGIVGSVNHRHFSFMGYIPIAQKLVEETGPEVARKLQSDGVDLALLVPS